MIRGALRPVRTGAVPGYETVPVDALAALLLFLLCAQSIGEWVPLAELSALGLLLACRWRQLLQTALGNIVLLALPVFTVLSATWSDIPDTSLRYAFQFFITGLIGIAIARTTPLARFALIVFVGTGAATLIGLTTGRTGISDTGPVLIGLGGSKNQMGYTSLFWLVSALCVATEPRRAGWLRIVAIGCTPVAAWLIVQSAAATATVSAVAATVLLLMLLIASRLPHGARLFALSAAVLLGIGMSAATPQIRDAAERFRTDVLEKDPRLTGRTLLWEEADALIAEAPVAGHGYKAVLMGEKGVAVLGRMGHRDGRLFHFHDTFRELRVDVGLIGLGLFLVLLLATVGRLAVLLVKDPRPRWVFVTVALAIICARMRTEVVLGPFALDTVILFAIFTHVWAAPAVRQTTTDVERTPPVRYPAPVRFRPRSARAAPIRGT